MEKVVVSYPLPKVWLAPLKDKARLEILKKDATRPQLLAAVGDAVGLMTLLTDRVDAELLATAPRLRIVANVAAGFNNIDLAAARRAGIWVTNTPDVLTDATADLTWALILTVARQVLPAEQALRRTHEVHWAPTAWLGTSLTGKVLGIVGWGRIGRAVATRALGFGMRVQYTDEAHSSDRSTSLDGTGVSLARLAATSDVISVHVPLTLRTRHLVNARLLKRMRHSTILINTSRGPVVDEQALAAALHKKQLGGAGLDVYENEPAIFDALLTAPNVVLLPHIGSATREARHAMGRLAAQNVAAVLAGKPPLTPVIGP